MPCDSPFFDGYLGFNYVASDPDTSAHTKTHQGMAMQRRRSIVTDCVPEFVGRQYIRPQESGISLAHGLFNWCCNYHGQTSGGGKAPCQQPGVHMISSPIGAAYCGQTGGQPPPGPGPGPWNSTNTEDMAACVAMCDTDWPIFEDCGIGEDVGYDFSLVIDDGECGLPPGIFVEWSTQVDGDVLNHGPAGKQLWEQCCYQKTGTFFDANGMYEVEINMRWRTANCGTPIHGMGLEIRLLRPNLPEHNVQCVVRNRGQFGIPWDVLPPNPRPGEPPTGHWFGPIEYPPPEGAGQWWALYNTETQLEVGYFIFRAHEN